MPEGGHGMNESEHLAGYLKGRDCPCPACGYNLRDLRSPACPECAAPLTIRALRYRRYNAITPSFFLGLAGMPRRIPDYALQFVEFNAISTVGAFILGFSQLIFAYNVWKCVKGGTRATDKVWEGAEGLEWDLSSPPPHHSWEVQPVIK